jgi:limonene-1,2-epoxide hydrolase
MRSNEEIVRNFLTAWSRLDVDELVGYFAANGTYHNMMAKPVTGHEALRRFIGGFVRGWSATSWEVVNIVSRDDLVVAERVDRTRVGDRQVELPCCGVFELSGGKIRVWRDYFDLATYTRAVG